MQIRVVRSVFTDTSVMGKMYIDNEFFGYTCEDKDRDLRGNIAKKVKGKTAIDYGRYEVVCSFSNHFQKYLPLLLNVPCFEGIRIHGGNTSEDSEGCILVGAEGDMKSRVWTCKGKIATLVAKLKEVEKKEKSWIELVKG